MKCTVCGKEDAGAGTRDLTILEEELTVRGRGGLRTLEFAVCPTCRERILRDSTNESLAAVMRSLALGSFRDTVA